MAHARKRSRPHVVDLFTDRVPQSVAFARSLRAQRAFLDSESQGEESARNVLVFHGVGGVGKTTLSRRLQDWVSGTLPSSGEWGPRPLIPVSATARIDLHGAQGNFNPAAAVVALRRALGAIKPRWPAFDLAFGAWWAAAHPGEPLPGAGEARDQGFAAAVSDTASSLLADLGIFDTAIGLGFLTARLAARKLAQSRDRRFVAGIVDQDYFRDLLLRCADLPTSADPHPELLVEAADLLALELDRETPCPLVVMFVDTLERIQLSQDHARLGEAMLNELIWALPQVLFVITGRNRLDWADPNDKGSGIKRTNLQHAGAVLWPGLVEGVQQDPRQHLIGDLSEDDTRDLILRFKKADGLPISDVVVEELIQQSNGLPQYLDLAREVALKIKRGGDREVTMADVTGSLGDLVERVMDDIPPDEQGALRAAALFARFEPELIAATANVSVGCAKRAVSRPMVEYWKDSDLPYRMHETVRSAIRHAGHWVAGGWAEQDWIDAGQRALAELQRRIALAAQEERDIDRLQLTAMAITLACDEDVTATDPEPDGRDWLQREVVAGPSIGGLKAYVPTASDTPYGQGFIDFITARSGGVGMVTRETLLRSLTTARHPLSRTAFLHLAYVLRNDERFDASIAVWDEALSIKTSPVASYQRRLTMAMGRRSHDALDGFEDLDEAHQGRIRAYVDWNHGRPEPMLRAHLRRWERTTADGKKREAQEALGDYLRRHAFFHGVTDLANIHDFVDQCLDVGYAYGVQAGLAARITVAPFAADALEMIERMAILGQSDLGRPDPLTTTARLCVAYANEDDAVLAEVARTLNYWPHDYSNWILPETLLNHLGHTVEYPPAQWLEPFEVVEQRWVQHWHTWRDRVVAEKGDDHAQ